MKWHILNYSEPIGKSYGKVQPDRQIIRNGETARFECTSDSEATWKFKRGRLPLNARMEHDFTTDKYILVIENMSKDNIGFYQCEGEDFNGTPNMFYDEGHLLWRQARQIYYQRKESRDKKWKVWQRIKGMLKRTKDDYNSKV